VNSAFTINVGGDIFGNIPEDVHAATVIAHGVNTRGVMGGFAGLIDTKLPVDAEQYRQACESGGVSPGGVLITGVNDAPEGLNLWVAHVVSQREPGPDARVEWLISALNIMYAQLVGDLEDDTEMDEIVVRLPLIGGGIGGIDPLVAASVIRTAAEQVIVRAAAIRTVLYLLDGDPHTDRIVSELGDR
jgi:O-acetyl-ADP-ribose deacetylase (regulator of RNase III)